MLNLLVLALPQLGTSFVCMQLSSCVQDKLPFLYFAGALRYAHVPFGTNSVVAARWATFLGYLVGVDTEARAT